MCSRFMFILIGYSSCSLPTEWESEVKEAWNFSSAASLPQKLLTAGRWDAEKVHSQLLTLS